MIEFFLYVENYSVVTQGSFGALIIKLQSQSGPVVVKSIDKRSNDAKTGQIYLERELEVCESIRRSCTPDAAALKSHSMLLRPCMIDSTLCGYLPYAEHGDLGQFLEKCKDPNDLQKVLFGLPGIKDAIDFLHLGFNMIHSDLKIENILVTGQFQLKIIDWEFAHRISSDGSVQLRGSPGWFSPRLLKCALMELAMQRYEMNAQDQKEIDIWPLFLIFTMVFNACFPREPLDDVKPYLKCGADILREIFNIAKKTREVNPSNKQSISKIISRREDFFEIDPKKKYKHVISAVDQKIQGVHSHLMDIDEVEKLVGSIPSSEAYSPC